jgi:hypothetical protein
VGKQHHSDYESWTATRTRSFAFGVFERYIGIDSLVRLTPFTAARRISVSTFAGNDRIVPAGEMDQLYATKPRRYMDSVGD